MPRKVNSARLESLKDAIEQHPGKRPGFIARLVGWRREEVNRALARFDKQGILLYEDDVCQWIVRKEGVWGFPILIQEEADEEVMCGGDWAFTVCHTNLYGGDLYRGIG